MSEHSTIARRALEAVVSAISKQARWPSGTAGGKGGQFKPGQGGGGKKPGGFKQGGFSGGGQKGPGQKTIFDEFDQWGGAAPKPKGPPPGAKPHPKAGDKGETITINYPSKPTKPSTWHDPDATAAFTPGSKVPEALNGRAFSAWTGAPTTKEGWQNVPGQNPKLDADNPFEPHPKKYTAAGVIVKEPDGRVWVTEPTNHFGGYQHTFPKGTAEPELSLQANAIKEAYEETGLQVRITGIAGDYEKTTSFARFYVAERVGGTPADMGWESQAVKLAPSSALPKLLNMSADRGIVDDLRAEQFLKRAAFHAVLKAKGKGKGSFNANQPRWPSGSALGGQWKAYDGAGIVKPPTIAGGLEGSNKSYQKKVDAAYALAAAGDKKALLDAAVTLQKAADKHAAKPKKTSHVKWSAQAAQYAAALVSDAATMPKAEAKATKVTGPAKLSGFTKVGSKPGGSNPGGMYQNAIGEKVLIKGNLQKVQQAQNAAVSDDRARNEVLAAKLMTLAGAGAPSMSLVDLEGEYGGGLGVASTMVSGTTAMSTGNAAHLSAARADFAVHAWLGNYDVLGESMDNTVIKDGKAVNIDPGGAILFRAQGKVKDSFAPDAPEFETMRSTNSLQKAVYGGMSKSDLQASAQKLALVSDDQIKELVSAYGPKDVKGASTLAETLIARRDAILSKAGVMTLEGEQPPGQSAPEPAKAAPVLEKTITSGLTGEAKLEKPTFNSGLGDKAYEKAATKIEIAHATGELAAIKEMAASGKYSTTTTNGKKFQAYMAAAIADLELSQDATVKGVAAGAKVVTDTTGQAWTGDSAGVMQPAVKAVSVKEFNALKKEAGKFNSAASDGMANLLGQLATQGNLGSVEASGKGVTDPAFHAFKANLIATMKGEYQPKVAGAKKAQKISLEQAQKHHVASYPEPGTAPSEAAAMGMLAMEGKPGKLKQIKTNGDPALEALKANLLSEMYSDPAMAAKAPKIRDTTAADAAMVTEKPKGKLAAGAFEAKMLPEGNSNAGPNNKKVAAIKALSDAGDEKGILALNYGTNTYGKKQAELANDALAAMGSVHQVTPGQKKGTHSALLGGAAQPNTGATPVAQKPAPKPKAGTPDAGWVSLKAGEKVVEVKENFGVKSAIIEVAPKGFDANAFASPPDFFKTGKQGATGTWVSSKEAINEANNAAVKAIHDAAVNQGTYEKLNALTLPVVKNGQTVMVPVSEHPAAGVKEYHADVMAELKAQTRPTYKTRHSGSMTASYDAAAAELSASYATKDYASFKTHKKKAADYLVLSQDAAASVPVPEPGSFKETGPKFKAFKDFRAASTAAHAALSGDEQKALKAYTGSSYASWNQALRTGDASSSAYQSAQPMVQAFAKVAAEVPEGSILWRGIDVGESTFKGVTGGIIQDGSFNSASYGASPAFSHKPTWLKIHTAKGVKALDATVFSQFGSGEREVIVQNNTRYMVLKTEKHANFVDSEGKSHGQKTIVDVIALPH